MKNILVFLLCIVSNLAVAQTAFHLPQTKYVYKLTTESITSDATLTDDAVLFVALDASASYWIKIFVWTSSGSTGDFKYNINYTGTIASEILTRTEVPTGLTIGTDNENTLVESTSAGSMAILSSSSGNGMVVIEHYINTTNAGTYSFQWAQNTSDAVATAVLGGSYIQYTRVQ